MFTGVLGFELRYQLRNPVFWVAVVVFFLLAFGATTVDQIQVGAGGNVHKNAPFAILQMMLIFSLFYMFVSTAFVANVIVRDDDSGFGPIVRATRITRAAYVFGRFSGAFIAAALGFLAIPLAIWLGSHMPWLDPDQIGSNALSFYLVPYLWLALPNLFLTAGMFFALATTTRSMMATYIGVVGFLIAWTIASVVLDRNPAYELIGAYGEPMGFGAVSYMTKYWTAADRNALPLPLHGLLFWNRMIALGIGGIALAFAFATFRFADKPSRKRRQARKIDARAAAEARPIAGPLPSPRYGRALAWAQLAARTRLEMVQVFRSPAYFVLMALGLFNAGASLIDLREAYGTSVYPVTRIVIGLLQGSFGFIPVIIAIYYAGELVWRERDRRTHEIIDATAIPDWAFVVPKALAVMLVMFSTLLISVAAGVVVQLLRGYGDLELGKYLFWYVVPMTIGFTLLAVLAVFIQALSPHKFIGWGIMVLYLISRITFANLGYGDILYNYAATPTMPLSDMNGAGRFWIGRGWAYLYWSAFAMILLCLAHVLWRRGTETRLRPRLARAPRRLRGAPGIIAAGALAAFVATGGWIYTNTHVRNVYRTSVSADDFAADYEKALLPYARQPQLSVQAVRLAIDLRPHEPHMTGRGTMTLVNRTSAPIRDLHLRLFDRVTRLVAVAVPGGTLTHDFARFQYRVYHLANAVAPGATMTIGFRTERGQRGFVNDEGDTRLNDNGTFLDSSELAPSIGMNRAGLLQDRVKRRKHGLRSELRPPKLEDLRGTLHNGYGFDWVRTDITVTTDADQTPIAPGYKVADATSGGRRTARFVVDAPILNFYSVQSARYAERHRRHGNIDLVAYYAPQHGMNVDRMLAAFAHALDYYEPNFSPYQFRQARVIEFPDYAQFAQAFAGTIPYSEGIGFIADLRNPDKVDYVTYITAHELGHQWWAHQAAGGDNQGATMLTESLAQYSALMVMEHLYGRDQMRRFLKYELDRYLRSRGGEAIEELPLDRVEDQGYIHYRKGSLVMYRLKDELGEARVNAALRRYVSRWKFRGPPYPRSLDLIAEFRRGASPAENALITDLFDRITLYDIKTRSATTRRLTDGRWETALTIEAHKLYADGRGKETEAPMTEQAEIGAFAAMPGREKFAAKDVLVLQRLPIRSGIQVLRLVTAGRPAFAGADPYNVRIDRNSDDNVIATTS